MPIGKLPALDRPSPRGEPAKAGSHVDYTTAFNMSISAGAARGTGPGKDGEGEAKDKPASKPVPAGGSGGVDYLTSFFKNLNQSTNPPDSKRVYSQKPSGSAVDAFTAFATSVKEKTGQTPQGQLYNQKPVGSSTDSFTAFATSVKEKTQTKAAAGRVYDQPRALAKEGSVAAAGVDAFTEFAMKSQKDNVSAHVPAGGQRRDSSADVLLKQGEVITESPRGAKPATPASEAKAAASAEPAAPKAEEPKAEPVKEEPAAKPAAEPASEPTVEAAPEPVAQPAPELAPEPAHEPAPEPAAAAKPTPEDELMKLSVEERAAVERARVKKGGAGIEFDPSEVAEDGGDATLDDFLGAMGVEGGDGPVTMESEDEAAAEEPATAEEPAADVAEPEAPQEAPMDAAAPSPVNVAGDEAGDAVAASPEGAATTPDQPTLTSPGNKGSTPKSTGKSSAAGTPRSEGNGTKASPAATPTSGASQGKKGKGKGKK